MAQNDWYEREEDAVIEAFNNGELTNEQCNAELRELQRDYAAAAEEAAQGAYEDEMSRW